MGDLRIMTWNILHDVPCEEADEHPWIERRDAARRIVETAHPDVLCVQEALPAQLDDLLVRLPDHWWVGRDREGGNDGEGCPIAFDTRRVGLVRWRQAWLGPDPERPGSLTWVNDVPRILTIAWFKLLDTGVRFIVANVHLDHLVPTTRTQSVELLHEILPRGTSEEPLILAGDFNTPAWTKPHWMLTHGDRPLHDTYRAKGIWRGSGGTYHHFTGKGLARVDWVLTEPELPVHAHRTWRDHHGGEWPSDHFPVVVDIGLGAPDDPVALASRYHFITE